MDRNLSARAVKALDIMRQGGVIVREKTYGADGYEPMSTTFTLNGKRIKGLGEKTRRELIEAGFAFAHEATRKGYDYKLIA